MEQIRQRTVRYSWKIQLTFNLVMLALAVVGVILRVTYGDTVRWALYALVGVIAVLFICRVVIMRYRVVFKPYEMIVRPMIGSDIIYDIDEVDPPQLSENGRLIITRNGETVVNLKPNSEGFKEAVAFLKEHGWFKAKDIVEIKNSEPKTSSSHNDPSDAIKDPAISQKTKTSSEDDMKTDGTESSGKRED